MGGLPLFSSFPVSLHMCGVGSADSWNITGDSRKVNKVGANAAALASLTPASFEGDEKWSLAASFGHYEGQTAGAVGAFYKPAENVMLNLRGSFASTISSSAVSQAIAF